MTRPRSHVDRGQLFGTDGASTWREVSFDELLEAGAVAPSPPDRGPCSECKHTAGQHWLGEPGGCEARGGCDCTTYRGEEDRPARVTLAVLGERGLRIPERPESPHAWRARSDDPWEYLGGWGPPSDSTA